MSDDTIGLSQGGAKDINNFRKAMANLGKNKPKKKRKVHILMQQCQLIQKLLK